MIPKQVNNPYFDVAFKGAQQAAIIAIAAVGALIIMTKNIDLSFEATIGAGSIGTWSEASSRCGRA